MRISDWSSDVCSSDLLFALAFEHFRNRDTGPLRDNLGNFLIGHLVTQQLVLGLAVLVDHLQAAFEVREDAVLQLSHARQIALTPPSLQLGLGLLDLLLHLGSRSEEHTSDLQSLMRISYAVF